MLLLHYILASNSNFVFKMRRFSNIRLQKWRFKIYLTV